MNEFGCLAWQLVCAVKKNQENKSVSQVEIEHFWEEVLILAEVHQLEIIGGFRCLN